VEDINNCGEGLELLIQRFLITVDDFLQQCMQDLMDGFFPSELQSRYPDGVPFEVQALCSCYSTNEHVFILLLKIRMANEKYNVN